MSHSHTPHLEQHATYRNIDIDSLELINSRILCRKITDNIHEPTKGGVFYPEAFNQNQYLYQNVDVVYEVVKLPGKLKKTKLSKWDTEMEVQVGDIIWVERNRALNSPDIAGKDGQYYRLISYYDLVVAKRGEEIIPLNGWCMMTNIYTQKMGLSAKQIVQEPRIIYALACVRYKGKPNKSYKARHSDEDIDFPVGAVVVLDLPNKNDKSQNRAYLEEDMFARFHGTERYFYEQRRSVLAVIENE